MLAWHPSNRLSHNRATVQYVQGVVRVYICAHLSWIEVLFPICSCWLQCAWKPQLFLSLAPLLLLLLCALYSTRRAHVPIHTSRYCMLCQLRLHNLTLSPQLFELWINRLTASAAGSELQLDIANISSWDKPPLAVITRSHCVFPTVRQGCDLLNWSIYRPYRSHFSKVRAGACPKWTPGCTLTQTAHWTSDQKNRVVTPMFCLVGNQASVEPASLKEKRPLPV